MLFRAKFLSKKKSCRAWVALSPMKDRRRLTKEGCKRGSGDRKGRCGDGGGLPVLGGCLGGAGLANGVLGLGSGKGEQGGGEGDGYIGRRHAQCMLSWLGRDLECCGVLGVRPQGTDSLSGARVGSPHGGSADKVANYCTCRKKSPAVCRRRLSVWPQTNKSLQDVDTAPARSGTGHLRGPAWIRPDVSARERGSCVTGDSAGTGVFRRSGGTMYGGFSGCILVFV